MTMQEGLIQAMHLPEDSETVRGSTSSGSPSPTRTR